MKKKMIFIFPGYYNFDQLILEGFKKYTDYEIIHIDPVQKYKYRSFFEKILNGLSKFFLRINLKNQYFAKKIILDKIESTKNVDIIFVNRPDLLTKKTLLKLEKKCDKRVVLFWDSFSKIPDTKDALNYFNKPFTFDFNDSITYNIPLISNFFIDYSEIEQKEEIFDFFYLTTYDSRYESLIIIIENLIKRGFKCGGIIFHQDISKLKNKKKYFTYTNKAIPFKDSFIYAMQSKYILDISHNNQNGLSFRVFEALGLGKKIITTNKAIIKQDFYNENNVFLLEDLNTNIPTSFFETEFIKIDENIIKKYTQREWILRLLN